MRSSKNKRRPRRKILNLDTFNLNAKKFYYEHTLMGMATRRKQVPGKRSSRTFREESLYIYR